MLSESKRAVPSITGLIKSSLFCWRITDGSVKLRLLRLTPLTLCFPQTDSFSRFVSWEADFRCAQRWQSPGYCVVCSEMTVTHGLLINGLKTEKRTDIHRTSVTAAQSVSWYDTSVWMWLEFHVFLVMEDTTDSLSVCLSVCRILTIC